MPIKVSQRPEYAALAALLLAARERAGLSQSELARRLGKRPAFVWKLENAYRSPDLVELMDLAAAMGTDVVELVRALRDLGSDNKSHNT